MANPTQQIVSAADSFQQQQSEEENSPRITHPRTEEDLSALEKIEKLKKQWLELLP
jgi:hypothetical protein